MDVQAHEAALASRVRAPRPAVSSEQSARLVSIHVDQALVDGKGPTTRQTEDNELHWIDPAWTPEVGAANASRILDSEAWRLLHECIRGWADPPGTSDRSCLLPAYEGFHDSGDGRQAPDAKPIPFSDEIFLRAELELFGKSSPIARREVLIVLTSRMRRFFVDLNAPDDPSNPGLTRHIEVICSLEGQHTKQQAAYRRFAFRGPQIAAAAERLGRKPCEYAYQTRKSGQAQREFAVRGTWVPEMDRLNARKILDYYNYSDGNDRDREGARQHLANAPRPAMLSRRFYRAA